MAKFYGIESLGSLSTLTTHREAGYTFVVNEDITITGFRLYTPVAVTNISCRLWDSSQTVIASATVVQTESNNWVEVYLDEPICLLGGQTYTVSCWIASNRYSCPTSSVATSPSITITTGCYEVTEGVFPSTSGSNIYQIIDIIYDLEVEYKKYYYNEVLLPEIPSNVLNEYPYCWIRDNNESGYYDLFFSNVAFYLVDSTSISGNDITKPWYRIKKTSADSVVRWTYYKDSTADLAIDSSRTVMWSNHDILNGSATSTDIYFYGSEPIPEGGSEPDGPDLEPEHSTKYLLKSEDMLCTVIDDELVLLDVEELTAELFHSHGFDELPEWSVISSLTNPEILYWQGADVEAELPTMTATMIATPYPQTIISPNYDMSDDTILGVECAYVTASSDVVFAISVDDGASWYMWTGSAWGTLTDATTGMTAETINAITTEQWAGLMTTGQFKVRATLFDENSSFTSFVMDYIN